MFQNNKIPRKQVCDRGTISKYIIENDIHRDHDFFFH